MPSADDLRELKDLLLAHAIKPASLQDPGRQYCAMSHILDRHIAEGENCRYINIDEILRACPSKKGADHPDKAVHRLKGDIELKLNAFYDGIEGKPPNHESLNAKYRATFKEKGSFALIFPDHRPLKAGPNWPLLFWRPHLPPLGAGKVLYPEPVFFKDGAGTYFRNAAMKASEDKSLLNYLKIPGYPESLKPSYSYVPSGIVQAVLALSRSLRVHADNAKFADCAAIDPHQVRPPVGEKDFILLATPTSTELVNTIQGNLEMIVDENGVKNADGPLKNDDASLQWGVATRTSLDGQAVTLLTAKHGRSIEAMAKYLVGENNLNLLASRMRCVQAFPEEFQVLFRIRVIDTGVGAGSAANDSRGLLS